MTDHTEAVTRAREHTSSAPMGRVFVFGGPWRDYCKDCGQPWPCVTADLLAACEEVHQALKEANEARATWAEVFHACKQDRDQARAAVERVRAEVANIRGADRRVGARLVSFVLDRIEAALDGPTEDTEPGDPS